MRSSENRAELDRHLIQRQLAQQARVWLIAKKFGLWAGGLLVTALIALTFDAAHSAARGIIGLATSQHDMQLEQKALSRRVDDIAESIKNLDALPPRVAALEASRDSLQRAQEANSGKQDEILKQIAELRGFVNGQQSTKGEK